MKKLLKSALVLTFLGVYVVVWAKVTTESDRSVNFTNYKTYSWLKVKASEQLWEDRIKSDVDTQLIKKSWQPIASGGDAAVSAFAATREQPGIETFYDGLGGGWAWRGLAGVDSIAAGALVVDIFDGRSKKLIWRSVAQDALAGNPDKDEKKLSSAVEEMFKHFPPKPKG